MLLSVNHGIFMIESKNYNENNASKAFKESIEQCENLKDVVLPAISEDYKKLPFIILPFIPKMNSLHKNDKYFCLSELKNVNPLNFLNSPRAIVEKDIYEDFLNLICGLKIEYDKNKIEKNLVSMREINVESTFEGKYSKRCTIRSNKNSILTLCHSKSDIKK